MGEAADTVRAYKTKHRLSFTHVLDADRKVALLFSVSATPTNFLLDRRGRILGGGAGYRDWSAPEAHELIQSLLKASPDQKAEKVPAR
jgi:peroxiredoxin